MTAARRTGFVVALEDYLYRFTSYMALSMRASQKRLATAITDCRIVNQVSDMQAEFMGARRAYTPGFSRSGIMAIFG